MNYLAEIRAFYDWLETNELEASGIALWYALMWTANKAGWPDCFAVATSTLAERSRLSPRSVERVRNQLQQAGLIGFKSRKGKQSAVYQMRSLVRHPDAQADAQKAVVRHSDAQPVAQRDAQQSTTLTRKLSPLKDKLNPNGTRQNPKSTPPNPPKADVTPKTAYAEFVRLTEAEYGKLAAAHGEEGARRMIEILDNYKGAKGAVYKSDYRAILNWVVERYREEREKGRAAKRQGSAGRTKDTWLEPDTLP